MENKVMEEKRLKLSLSANQLKLIAIIAMVIGHTGSVFIYRGQYPGQEALASVSTFVNYLAAPIFFYFLVEGYRKTRNINRYMLRMGIFFVISYLPFILFTSGGDISNVESFLSFNVFFTLLLGLCLLRVRNEVKTIWQKYALTALIFTASIAGDWHYIGLLMMVIFDHFYADYKSQAFAYSALILGKYFLDSALLPLQSALNLPQYAIGGYSLSVLGKFSILEWLYIIIVHSGRFSGVWLLQFYNGSRGRDSAFIKFAFYIVYPLHLLILGIIRYFL